ncbi:MAG: TolC family outer membrane protein [Ferrimonas sp.]
MKLPLSRIVLAISALLSGHSSAATLEQTVAHTLDTNPSVRLNFNRFKAAEEQVNEARGQYLPQIDLYALHGYDWTDSPTGRADGDHNLEFTPTQAGISISQLLFDGFRSTGEVARLGYEASAEQWALINAAENIALSVVQSYLAILTAEQQLELAEHNLANHQQLSDKIQQRADSGLGSSADLAQSKGRLARAFSNRIAAYNNLLDAQAQFENITAFTTDELTLPIPDLALLPSSLGEALQQTEQHPLLKSAALDINAAQQQQRVAQADYYPSLHLKVDGNWGDDIDYTSGHNNDIRAIIEMRYNLFSGGSTKAKIRTTAYQIGEAKAIREQAIRDVQEGMRLSWHAFQSLSQQKRYLREHVEASKVVQLAYAEQFRLGQRSLLDLLDTENELFQARYDYIQTEMDELFAQYRLLNAGGQLLNSLRITQPPAWQTERDYQ